MKTTLLLDNTYLELADVTRQIHRPVRHRATPVISGGVANFSHTIIKQSGSSWRIWYMGYKDETTLLRHTVHATSRDGWIWRNHKEVAGSEGFEFTDVIDTGKPGLERYLAYRKSSLDRPNKWRGELVTSPDGLDWQNQGAVTDTRYGETWQAFQLGSKIGLLHRSNIRDYTWHDSAGVLHINTIHDPFVRCIALTTSANPHHFPASTLVFAPDGGDEGETQFYAVSNIIEQGGYFIGILQVLHDEKVASGVRPGAYGMGHSVLMWSADGYIWHRSRHPFFSPDPEDGTWDHAVAWIDSIVVYGDATRYYYGGYGDGHKVFVDRGIGAVKTKNGRFASVTGTMRTLPFENKYRFVSLNMQGPVQARVLDINNNTLAATALITANSVNRPTGLNLGQFDKKIIKLEFETAGRLYGFHLK